MGAMDDSDSTDERDAIARRYDPRGLIRESYRMEGLEEREIRAIFFDWALGFESAAAVREAACALRVIYATAAKTHPMSALLSEAAEAGATRGKAGGARRRRRRAGATREQGGGT